MKLAQFRPIGSSGQSLGVLIDDRVVAVSALAMAASGPESAFPSWMVEAPGMLDIIERGEKGLAEIKGLIRRAPSSIFEIDFRFAVPVELALYLPPVYPSKIIAIGRNQKMTRYREVEPPAAPLIFAAPNSLRPTTRRSCFKISSTDYEAELAVVIGRRATRVSESEALNYVFGYTLINDVSARDLQFGDGQWVRGKGLDGFAPLGPFITTRDEIPDVQSLNIEGRLNGEVMQSSNTSKMIFQVPYLVSYISQGITLEPGDVIATGTPEGVGIFRKPPVLLKAGDVFEVNIEGLGTLRNPVVAAD
jgi:acylpyruvate hydrolase